MDVKLTVADVADWLGCSSSNVEQMVKLSRLHPVSDEDGELYFEAAEVRSIKCIPINRISNRRRLARDRNVVRKNKSTGRRWQAS